MYQGDASSGPKLNSVRQKSTNYEVLFTIYGSQLRLRACIGPFSLPDAQALTVGRPIGMCGRGMCITGACMDACPGPEGRTGITSPPPPCMDACAGLRGRTGNERRGGGAYRGREGSFADWNIIPDHDRL